MSRRVPDDRAPEGECYLGAGIDLHIVGIRRQAFERAPVSRRA